MFQLFDHVSCRHWFFETGSLGGPVIEASGEGVIGQKPILRPGQCFEYYSGTSLTTPWGHMYGELTFTRDVSGSDDDAASEFKARIDRTLLAGASAHSR